MSRDAKIIDCLDAEASVERSVANELMSNVSRLDDALTLIEGSIEKISDEDERKRYKRELGIVMVEIYDKIMRPVIKEYPDLDPDK